MPYYCTVPKCKSMGGKVKSVSFHKFPKDEVLANLWNKILRRGKPYTKYSKVCSLHFKPDDFINSSVGKHKRFWKSLRKDAIPSEKLPVDELHYVKSQSDDQMSTDEDPIMAQAIYMQTMMSMETTSSENVRGNKRMSDLGFNSKKNPEQTATSHKCPDCSKRFKDPDVLTIHRRSHLNSSKSLEKENLDSNTFSSETLKANPILASHLMSLPDQTRLQIPEMLLGHSIFDTNNILNLENQIMAALAANMEAYIKNLSTMLAQQHSENKLNEINSHIEGISTEDLSVNDGNSSNSELVLNICDEQLVKSETKVCAYKSLDKCKNSIEDPDQEVDFKVEIKVEPLNLSDTNMEGDDLSPLVKNEDN